MQPAKRVRCEDEAPLTTVKRLGTRASGLSPWYWEDELPEPDYMLKFREKEDYTPILGSGAGYESTTYGLVEIPNTGERLLIRKYNDVVTGLIIEVYKLGDGGKNSMTKLYAINELLSEDEHFEAPRMVVSNLPVKDGNAVRVALLSSFFAGGRRNFGSVILLDVSTTGCERVLKRNVEDEFDKDYDVVYRPGSTTLRAVTTPPNAWLLDPTGEACIVTYSMLTGERCSSVRMADDEEGLLKWRGWRGWQSQSIMLLGDGTISKGRVNLTVSSGKQVRVSKEICHAVDANSLISLRATCTANLFGLHNETFGLLLFHRVNLLRKTWIEATVKLAAMYES